MKKIEHIFPMVHIDFNSNIENVLISNLNESIQFVNTSKMLLKSGDYKSAIEILHKAENISDDYDTFFLLGFSYVKSGLLEPGLEYLEKANRISPGLNPSLYYLLGFTYNELNISELALVYTEKAISLNRNEDFFMLKANIYNKLQDFEKGIACLQAAYELAPKNGKIQFKIGEAYVASSNYQHAVIHFLKAIELSDRPQAKYYFCASMVYHKLKDFKNSLRYVNKAIEIEINNEHFLKARALIHIDCNNRKAAIEDLNTAISLNPTNHDLLLLLGKTLYEVEEYRKAIDNLTFSINLFNQSSELCYFRGLSYYFINYFNEAKSDLLKSAELGVDEKNSRVIYFLAKAHEHCGELDLAMQYLNKAIEIDPSLDALYLERACLSNKLNKPLDAIEDYETVIKLNSKDHFTFCEYGRVLAILKRYDAAIDALSKAIELNECSTSYYNRAKAYKAKGLLFEAKDDFLKVLDLPDNEKFLDVFHQLAQIFLMLEKHNDCLKFITLALEINEKDPALYYTQAKCLIEMNHIEVALSAYQKAFILEPNPSTLFNISLLHEHKGQFDMAIENITRAIEMNQKSAILLIKRARYFMLNSENYVEKCVKDICDAITLEADDFDELFLEDFENLIEHFKDNIYDCNALLKVANQLINNYPDKSILYLFRAKLNVNIARTFDGYQDFEKYKQYLLDN